MESIRNNWLATVLLAFSLTACGGGGEDEADAGVTAETADEIQSALTVRQAVQQATIVTGAAPKSTATDEAPELNTDGGSLLSVDAGDTVDLGLTISALEGVSSLLARVVGATNYLQINDPNLSATGTTAKAFGSATVFSGQVQVQIPSSLRSGQFCIEIAAVDQAGRVSNYRKICFQIPQNLAPSAPPQVNAGGDVAVGDDVATVTLTGEAKLASGLDVASYQWRQLGGGPTVSANGSTNQAQFSFAVPNVSGSVDLRFELRVTDSAGGAGTDTVVVSVADRDVPEPPQVTVGADRQVDEGGSLTLVGSATDTDSAISSVQWQSSRPDLVQFNPVGKATTTVVVGRVPQTTTVQLTLRATDQTGLSAQRSLNLTIRDVAAEPQSLTLSGISALPALPGGAVTVFVGNQTYTGTVAANGSWSVLAQSSNPQQMVRVAIQSADDTRIRVESYLGQWSDLTAAAVNNALDTDDSYALRVGAFTSALAAALREQNAIQTQAESVHLDLTSSGQLAAAAYGVPPEHVLDNAALLLLMAAGSLGFDAAFSSMLGTLRDYTTVQALQRTAIANLSADFILQRAALVSDLPNAPAVEAPDAVGRFVETGLHRFHLSGDQFELTSGGTARYDAGSVSPAGAIDGNVSQQATWTVAAGEILVVPNTPAQFTFTATNLVCGNDPSPRQSEVEQTINRYRLQPVLEVPGRGPILVRRYEDVTERYVDAPDCDDVERTNSYLSWFSRVENLAPFAVAVEPGTQLVLAGINRDPDADDRALGFRADLFRFASGGVGTTDGFGLGSEGVESFSWRIDSNGALRLDYPDGTRASFHHLTHDDDIGFEILVLVENGNGYRSATRTDAVRITDEVSLTTGDAPGRWSQFGDRRPFANGFTMINGFGLKLFADGEFVQFNNQLTNDGFDSGGEVDTIRLGGWQVVDSEVVIDSRYDSETFVDNCDPASPSCEVYSRRIWRPVARTGNRYYMLENRFFGPPLEQVYIDLRFYDRSDLPVAKSLRPTATLNKASDMPKVIGVPKRQP